MKTQQHFLIKSLLVVSTLAAGLMGYAQEPQTCIAEQEVVQRSGKHGYKFVKEQLKDLYCGRGFEGKYFKVVYKKDNKAVPFDSDPDLVRRAANVYYHLTKARDFWVNEVNSEYVKEMDQITVRVQIENGFSRLGHFENDGQASNSNNAWTIPAGQTPRWAEHQDKWGQEIWFSPMKKEESRKLISSNGNNPLTGALEAVKHPVLNYTEGSLTQSMLDHLVYPAYQDTTLLQTIINHLAVIGATHGVVAISKKMDKLFMDKYYYIDTAMVPEIIYHEYSHVALSDYLMPKHSIAVIEGMADYFATRIANTVKMYRSIKNFSTNAEKNAKNKKFYNPWYEHENNANSDFTLSVLWLIKAEMDKANKRRIKKGRPALSNVDQLIYESRKNMDAESSILQMTQALKKTCETNSTVCSSKRLGVGTLNVVFEKKGF